MTPLCDGGTINVDSTKLPLVREVVRIRHPNREGNQFPWNCHLRPGLGNNLRQREVFLKLARQVPIEIESKLPVLGGRDKRSNR